MTNTSVASSRDVDHFLGPALVAAGWLGALVGVALLAVPPSVPADRYSYPLGGAASVTLHVFLAVQHLVLMAGLTAVARSALARGSLVGRIGLVLSMAGMATLAALELAVIPLRDEWVEAPAVLAVRSGFGLSSMASGLGGILLGVGSLRGPWRGAARWLPMVHGVYVFVVMTPAIVAGGFVGARLGIAGWMVLFALLGHLVTRTRRVDG